MKPELSMGIPEIGVTFPRRDAFAKVIGREKYSADYYSPDMLWAGVKRSDRPHADIKAIRTEKAVSMPGVARVITHRDIKGPNIHGVVLQDQPVLSAEKVLCIGDPLAVVVADSPEILAEALAAIEVELEELPGVFSPEEALKPDAPVLHPGRDGGNLVKGGVIQKGEGADALEKCPVVVQALAEVPRQEHAYLETEAGWAVLGDDGVLAITASTQAPFRDRTEVAHALGLDPEKVRVIAPYLGGGFGGKDGLSVQGLLALAAIHCPGRPVKMWWNREESFTAGVKRHPGFVRCRLGADKQGNLLAMDAEIVLDTGPYEHLGSEVMALGMEHLSGPYFIPNARVSGKLAYTNNPVSGPFRGFGVPQAVAATEQAMDLLAFELGRDPLELRRQNAIKTGQKTAIGSTLISSNGFRRCLEIVENHPLWKDRRDWIEKAPRFIKRGCGMAAVWQGMGYGPLVPDVGNAKLRLKHDGGFAVYSGVPDMGQGNSATNVQVAARLLGQDASRFELVQPDTKRTLPSGSASASRTTFTFIKALIPAARELGDRIRQRAGDLMFIADWREMELIDGRVRHLPTGGEMSLAQVAATMSAEERVVVKRFRAKAPARVPIVEKEMGTCGVPHALFSFGVHLAKVEVDTLTGRVRVVKYLVAGDCGSLINPQLMEQQMQGGVAQGMGYALMEDMVSQDGVISTPDLATYIIPTSMDLPDMEFIPAGLHEPEGPFGLKGAGEIAMDGPLPSVANAVAQALGGRSRKFPLTPERVLNLVESNGE